MSKGVCSQCGQGTPPKRLTDLGPAGKRCPRCLDHLPPGQRHQLLRRAKQANGPADQGEAVDRDCDGVSDEQGSDDPPRRATSKEESR